MADHDFSRLHPANNPPDGFGFRDNPQVRDPFLDPANNRAPQTADTDVPSTPFLANGNLDKEAYYTPMSRPTTKKRPFYKRPCVWIIGTIILAIIIAVAVVGGVHRPNHSASNANHTSTPGDAGQGNPTGTQPGSNRPLLVSGADGSTVTKEDGTTFPYHNPFGGFWVHDYANPFNSSARCNSWTPPLDQPWNWGKDRIHGVNLGGLFVLEPFISPAIFEQNPGSVDEWTLSVQLQKKGQLQQVLEDHYNSFITEEDIAQIAGAGLNWLRLPIPFWAVGIWDDVGTDANGQKVSEPFLAKVCWKYILRTLQWARKYGLRVLLDLHTVPGSQNGYNHSGKNGAVNWLNGIMGFANAQRSLDILRSIVEFCSQPEWQNVVVIVGILNEPYVATIGQPQLQSYYYEAYKMVRSITGTGEGKGPVIAFHDGFEGFEMWANFLTGADRIAIDNHPYFAFDGAPNREPVNLTAVGGQEGMMGGKWPKQVCDGWAGGMATSRSAFGISFAGEFSNAVNDCGQWVVGVGTQAVYGPDCEYWEDASGWSQETKQGLMNFAMATMDALGDWFFWTWKIGNSSTTNTVRAPLWSYKLGLENGWMPKDPRLADGFCGKLGSPVPAWDGVFQPWQTGGAGAGQITPQAMQNILAWPPQMAHASSGGQVPEYARTGSPVTLAPPSFSGLAKAVRIGNGWANTKDTTPGVAAIPGCAYPNAWDALDAQVPAAGCSFAAPAVPPAVALNDPSGADGAGGDD